ncbi:MAG TPA: carotenoid biosynthesis protein [Thermococcus paralvinellae]|uniref:Carotenoid biosynthesis protein n=1 Tax=Thermococcus paralvinellae TaxID=582419 RepID=A0A833E2R4_9EURY|nr:carotenoid biosynthesis protein [Thermococcus paralvinellae]
MRRELRIILTLILLANLFKRSPMYIAFYLFAMFVASHRLWKDLPRFFIISSSVGFFAEVIGTNVCAPFGCYYYENLKPQIFGVALFVPIAWTIFGFISYLTAHYLFKDKPGKIVFASILMVIMDLSVDPIMTSWRAWVWETTTEINWFGIPWTNYLGWFVVSLTFFYLYERFSSPQIENELLKFGPPAYLLEMFTFAVYAPTGVKISTIIAFVISIVIILPMYFWRIRVQI